MSTQRHPRYELVDIFMHPIRLSLVAQLAEFTEIEFALLQQNLELTPSVLSKQASLLASHGFIAYRKEFIGKYPKTWLRLTSEGRRQYKKHVAALRKIANQEILPSN